MPSDILPNFPFENMGLHPKLLQALKAHNYLEPTEIQKARHP